MKKKRAAARKRRGDVVIDVEGVRGASERLDERRAWSQALERPAPPSVVRDATGVYVRVPPELVGAVERLVAAHLAEAATGLQRFAAENPAVVSLLRDALSEALRSLSPRR